jgi:hypothetical protein
VRVLECNLIKPRSFSNFCRVPGFTFSQASSENLSMLYTYVTGFDVDKAKKDFNTYVDKKNAEYDAVIEKIKGMKKKLEDENKRRMDELEVVEKCEVRVTLLPKLKEKQKEFNSKFSQFYGQGTFTTAAIKTSPMITSRIEECSKKIEDIKKHLEIEESKKQLESKHETEYDNIKKEMDNFTYVIVIDGDNNKILFIYDLNTPKQTVYTAPVASVAPSKSNSVVLSTI